MDSLMIGRLRLAAQQLSVPVDTPENVVAHLLAMQAQDYNGGLWSVGVRMNEPSKSAVEKAIMDRRIIRTWPMRGTLHFVHTDDVRWLLDLLAVRATAAARSRRLTMGLTDEIVGEAENRMRHALKGGRSILRGDVVTLFADIPGITIDNQHTQHLMRNFGERGIICFGPYEGKQPTFVLLDEWAEKRAPKPKEDALKELALRYFTGHGPATLKDFAGWGMMTMRDARSGLESALPQLDRFDKDGTTYYHAPVLKPGAMTDPLLLSGFDEYLLGYKDRSPVLAAEHANKIVPGNNGMFLATVVNDGQVVGLWKRTTKARGVTHAYEPFTGELPTPAKYETLYETFLTT